jgi:hypothetical protein
VTVKRTCCLGIEPAENGWIVVESIFFEETTEEADEVSHSSYDPSAAFADGEDKPHHCIRKEERVHVFTDVNRLLTFVGERLKNGVSKIT